MQPILNAVLFIFGGCCSNVITFEALLENRTSGSLITFCQFLFVSLVGIPNFVHLKKDDISFKRLRIPLRSHLVAVVLFFISSTTNNIGLQYNISVPLHIVFRCSGTIITMTICWLFANKKYSKLQILSTLFLTMGAIVTSVYKDEDINFHNILNSTPNNKMSSTNYDRTFILGICILTVSSITSSFLSVYNELTYRKYGKYWQESLFYSNLLSLPLFLINFKQLSKDYNNLIKSTDSLSLGRGWLIPYNVFWLIGNILTQHVCISGVNLLSSQTNALTVSVILLVRKFASLLLSVYMFNNVISTTGYVGIGIVFTGALMYILGSQRVPNEKTKKNKIE